MKKIFNIDDLYPYGIWLTVRLEKDGAISYITDFRYNKERNSFQSLLVLKRHVYSIEMPTDAFYRYFDINEEDRIIKKLSGCVETYMFNYTMNKESKFRR